MDKPRERGGKRSEETQDEDVIRSNELMRMMRKAMAERQRRGEPLEDLESCREAAGR